MDYREKDSVRRILDLIEPDSPLRRLIMRAALAEKRAGVQMANSAPPGARAAERLNRQRFRRRILAKEAAKILGSSRTPIEKRLLASRYSRHPLLDALHPSRSDEWTPVLRRGRDAPVATATISRLSFLDDPAGTLNCLQQIVALETTALSATIDFDFDYVEDIAPFLVMGEFWSFLAPVFSGGGKMKAPVQKVISAVGLAHALGMHFPHLKNHLDVWALPVQRRRPTGKSASTQRYLEPQRAEVAADRLVDEINVWLGAAGTDAELTDDGRSSLKSLVTELLDNAERHSSFIDRDGSWSLAAFMARREVDGEVRYACHLAILSVGDTISESLEATASEWLTERIDDFVEALRLSGSGQTRATLVTLAALQDGVTRDGDALDASSGGYGFMHFVDSVNLLGLSNRHEFAPRITIISGASCIQLRAPYIRGERRQGEEVRRLLFNPSNTNGEPADEDFVYDLPSHFPGTIISVGFTLDPDFYRTVLNGNDIAE